MVKYFKIKYISAFLAILLFIFWPLAVFRDEISLDIPKFVEEWIKIGIISILLIVLIKIIETGISDKQELNFFNYQINSNIIYPLYEIEKGLTHLLLKNTEKDSINDLIWNNWKVVINYINSNKQNWLSINKNYDKMKNIIEIFANCSVEGTIKTITSDIPSRKINKKDIDNLKIQIQYYNKEIIKIMKEL